jgi:selenocysteine lyase/cysteine desulfurase
MEWSEVVSLIRENEVGRDAAIETPYGRRLLCYADLTATGRFVHFVETWVRCLRPYYANTHTAISSTGRIMTELREQARAVIARSVNAADDDVVLLVGAGATAAVNKLVGLLGLRSRGTLDATADRPVVLVGPYEHHSNELPWLESNAELVEVALADDGSLDLGDLERKLERFAGRALKVGAFSAASNVTGILTDVPAVARRLHRAGALAVFDYAAAAPYVPIDMHPPAGAEGDAHLDAVVLSTHKFIGGPQASGVLVLNRSLCRTDVPERPGGGTVDYVGGIERGSIDYTRRLEDREEGGTPAIVGDIRAGVAFLVKEMAGPDRILAHETELARQALERLGRHPRVRLLGPPALPRLAIISFNIAGLHHDLVSVLLDQLFGIQNRAGCSCAGPYGHRLLDIDRARSDRYRKEIARGNLGVKPGWVRLTLPFYASAEDVDFILSAVEFIADHGETFVPAYSLSWRDGGWRHIDTAVPIQLPLELTLEALVESTRCREVAGHEPPLTEGQLREERARYFREAHAVARALRARAEASPPAWNPGCGRADLDQLLWFRYVHSDGRPA